MKLPTVLFREQVDRFFSVMDRDFDGKLSYAEMMGEETPIEKLFKMMDKNGDGFISKKVRNMFVHLIDLPFLILKDLFTFSIATKTVKDTIVL